MSIDAFALLEQLTAEEIIFLLGAANTKVASLQPYEAPVLLSLITRGFVVPEPSQLTLSEAGKSIAALIGSSETQAFPPRRRGGQRGPPEQPASAVAGQGGRPSATERVTSISPDSALASAPEAASAGARARAPTIHAHRATSVPPRRAEAPPTREPTNIASMSAAERRVLSQARSGLLALDPGLDPMIASLLDRGLVIAGGLAGDYAIVRLTELGRARLSELTDGTDRGQSEASPKPG